MARSFNGTSDYLNPPANSIAGIDIDAYTIAEWIYPVAAGVRMIFMFAYDLISGAGLTRHTVQNPAVSGFRFEHYEVFSTQNGLWRSTSDYSLNTLYHFATTYDRSSTANDPIFYVNGSSIAITEVTAPSGTPTTGRDSLRVGANVPASGSFYSGRLSQLVFYDRILTAEEVMILKIAGPCALPYVPKIWYELFGTTSPEPDFSGNNNHATTINGTARVDHPSNINAIWLGNRMNKVERTFPSGYPAAYYDRHIYHSPMMIGG